jgi:hypothetical protein
MVGRGKHCKNECLLRVLPLTNILIGDLTTPPTVGLTDDGEVPLTLAYDLPCFLIPLYISRQFTSIPSLRTMIHARECSLTPGLYRIGDDDVKPLRECISDQPITTIVHRLKDLASSRHLSPTRRIGVDGVLDDVP